MPSKSNPSTSDTRRDTLYYDGGCGLCRRSVRIIRALDWLDRLNFQDSTSLEPNDLPIPPDAALVGIPMRTRRSAILIGFPALRRALAQTPLGALPALFLYLPGVSHLGRRVYQHIATNRSCDGDCTTEQLGVTSAK